MSTKRAAPMCAVCGRPVDSFTEEEGDEDVVWTARCHGKSERIRLMKRDLQWSKVTGLGLAFASETRRLPEQVATWALPPGSAELADEPADGDVLVLPRHMRAGGTFSNELGPEWTSKTKWFVR